MFLNNSLKRRLSLQKKWVALAFVVGLNAQHIVAQQWETVGNTPTGISPSWGSFQHLAKDATGNLYASFYDGSVTKGSVMKYNGTSWSYLGAAGITTGSATYSGLAVAGNGDVFYCNQVGWPGSGLEVRKFDGTAWSLVGTSAATSTVNFQSMATTSNNQPIVAYSSNSQPNVRRYDGTSWIDVGVGLPSGVPYYIDLKVVNDTAYVAWVGTSGAKIYKLHAMALGLSSWQEVGTTGFSATSSEQYRSSLAVDANNNVYFAFTSLTASGNKINVKKYTVATGLWTDVGTPNFSTHRVHYVSIAVNAAGEPYVAYSHFENSPNNKNFVYKFNGTTWELLSANPVSSGEAKWNALLIDNAGTPILAYSDESMSAGNMVKKFVPGTTPLCNNTMPGTTPGSTGCVTFNYQGAPVTYTTVRANDGNVWLQQNIGSSQVGNAANDTLAYGHYFQWGRWDDGHQLKNATMSTTAPSPNNPSGLNGGNANFYSVGYNDNSNWWYNGALTDTWQAGTAANATATNGCDPCKALGAGWRLPAKVELDNIISLENISNLSSGFNSNMKFVGAGMRDYNGMFGEGARAYIWSVDADANVNSWGQNLYMSAAVAMTNYGGRDGGHSLRCIYSQTVGVTSVDVTTQNNIPAIITTHVGTLQAVATVLPATASQDVTWSIVPVSGAATISTTGLVTASANGTVYAKAVSVAAPSLSDSILITISNQVVPATSIDVTTQNNAPATIATNAGTLQMEATILPATANQDVTWSIVPVSGNATISTSGLVTAQTNGTVYAKAIAVANATLMDSVLVTISNQTVVVTDLNVTTINNVPATINTIQGTLPLQAIITPSNATNSAVTWSIVPVTGTATISATGVVTAETNGTVYAKAVSVENANIFDSLLVTISGQGVGIKNVKNGLSFDVHPNPANDFITIALPKSSNKNVVNVLSADGKIIMQSTFKGKTTQLNVSALASGVYFIQVVSDEQYVIKKLIKH